MLKTQLSRLHDKKNIKKQHHFLEQFEFEAFEGKDLLCRDLVFLSMASNYASLSGSMSLKSYSLIKLHNFRQLTVTVLSMSSNPLNLVSISTYKSSLVYKALSSLQASLKFSILSLKLTPLFISCLLICLSYVGSGSNSSYYSEAFFCAIFFSRYRFIRCFTMIPAYFFK